MVKAEIFKEKQTLGTFRQFLATVCMGPISMGATLAWTSPVLPQFASANSTTPFQISVEDGSWVGSMLAVGALVSAIPAGFLADRFGVKTCIIGFSIPILIFTALIVFVDNFYAFCVARLIGGLSIGGISVAGPMYISEISDMALRGTMSSFFELLIYVGITFTAICGAYMHYITFTLLIGGFTLINCVIFIFLPESPTYLIKVQKRPQAEKALKFYRSKNFEAEEVLNEITDSIFNTKKDSSSSLLGTLKLLKSKAVVRGLIASTGLTIFQQLSLIDGICFYAVQIFEAADSVIDAYTCAIIMAALELLSALFLIFIVEKAGRKTFLYVSSIGLGTCLGLFAMYFSFKESGIDFYGLSIIPLASMFTYNFVFALGLGPVPWMVNGELFSPEIKGLANGITITANWTFLFVVTKTLPIMMVDWGASYTFYLYALFMVLCAVFVKFCVPETRGKTLEQIQVELNA